jgi:hypothetical protein
VRVLIYDAHRTGYTLADRRRTCIDRTVGTLNLDVPQRCCLADDLVAAPSGRNGGILGGNEGPDLGPISELAPMRIRTSQPRLPT